MEIRQVRFIDEENIIHGGIMVNGEYIICGCCGSVYEVEEVEILDTYDYWVPLSNEIIGE